MEADINVTVQIDSETSCRARLRRSAIVRQLTSTYCPCCRNVRPSAICRIHKETRTVRVFNDPGGIDTVTGYR